MKKISIAILCLLVSLGAYSQEKVKIQKSEFRSHKEGFSEAWKNVKLGDQYFELGGGRYLEALEHYRLALSYNDSIAPLYWRAAICAMECNMPGEALMYFLKAGEIDPDISPDRLLMTGKAYHQSGDFGKALDCYNIYSNQVINSGKSDPRVSKLIRECNLAMEMLAVENMTRIVNLGTSVNSPEDDYSPVPAGKGDILYFTSRRNVERAKQRQKADEKWDEGILVATRNDEGYSTVGQAGETLSSENNEGVLWVSRDNSKMYIYAGWTGNGDIYFSEYKKGKWSAPAIPEVPVNSKDTESSISVTDDGEEIYFTSNRKGSLGGRDIFYIRKVNRKKWAKPYNLGTNVNSQGNEEGVWVSGGGDTLWFSSNGREGLGGYDVFMSVRDENGAWRESVNLGPPVNSQSNDLFYRPSGFDNSLFFFSTDRPEGSGGLDIYRVEYSFPDTTGTDIGFVPVEVPDTLGLSLPTSTINL